jgi:hypothetical protein
MMRSIGIQPKKDIIELVSRTFKQNHLLYVYAYYFLVANGKESNRKNISRVVESLGIKVNKNTLKEALAYIDDDVAYRK